MFSRRVGMVVVAVACFAAGGQALGSSAAAPTNRASASSLSGSVAALSRRVRSLEQRVNALAYLEGRRPKVTIYTSPLIPESSNGSFQDATVNCPFSGEVAVGGGVVYPPATGPHSDSVMLQSSPSGSGGWFGQVFSPQRDAADGVVVCLHFDR